MEQSDDSHLQVVKIWHTSDITKNGHNFGHPSNINENRRKKNGRGGGQEAYGNIKELQGTPSKYWLCHTCDNNLPYFLYAWAVG